MNTIPNYKSHDRINGLILSGIVAGLAYYHVSGWYVLAFAVAYLIGTYLVTPDLDLDSRIYKRWGWLKIFWCPYKEVFKHRQCSHHLIFGPLSLVIYITVLIFIPVYYFKVEIPITFEYILIATAGLVLAIEIHIMTDAMSNILKRRKSGKKK